MRLSRGRFYGHPALVEYLRKLGASLKQAKLGPLLVGDLGLPRGGWMKSGHASHQTGIDVDLWYWVPPAAKRRSLTLREREVISARSLVPVKYSEKVDARYWKTDVQDLIRKAAEFPEVDRIFVNGAIKKDLCRKFASDSSNTAWLRKLRPWYAHDDHLHVRLSCPADSPGCKKQESIPQGSGCDSSIDWWFTKDARDEALKNALKARENPGPPPIADGCLPVLIQDYWAGALPDEDEGSGEVKPASESAPVPDDGQ
jgi:penicillin-insensitive murein endopeptidase